MPYYHVKIFTWEKLVEADSHERAKTKGIYLYRLELSLDMPNEEVKENPVLS